MHDDEYTTEQPFRSYRCYMSTRGGMYAQYDGHVDVYAQSAEPEELFRRAVTELRRTSFPDYSSTMWRLDRVELLT